MSTLLPQPFYDYCKNSHVRIWGYVLKELNYIHCLYFPLFGLLVLFFCLPNRDFHTVQIFLCTWEAKVFTSKRASLGHWCRLDVILHQLPGILHKSYSVLYHVAQPTRLTIENEEHCYCYIITVINSA